MVDEAGNIHEDSDVGPLHPDGVTLRGTEDVKARSFNLRLFLFERLEAGHIDIGRDDAGSLARVSDCGRAADASRRRREKSRFSRQPSSHGAALL